MSLTTTLIGESPHRGGWLVLCVVGDCDIYTAGQLRREIGMALDSVSIPGAPAERGEHQAPPPGPIARRGLVLDLSGVAFMDSSGLGVLVGAYQRAKRGTTPLRVAGATVQVSDLFRVTGLGKVFAMYSSVAEATLETC